MSAAKERLKAAIHEAASAHVQAAPEFDLPNARRRGAITAAWVDKVLVVTASEECAFDLEAMMRAGLLASPERAE